MRTRGRFLPAFLGLAVVAGCVPVTVNINFSQEKLDKAADKIEEMVRSPENPKLPAPVKPSSAVGRWLARLGPPEALAQGTTVQVAQEPRVDSPEIQNAAASRSARLGALQQWKAKGCIGENNQGLVEARPGQGCGSEVGGLIGAENADRQVIMNALMRQNNIPAGDAARVRAAFARVNRERAQPGDAIQQDSGQWTRK